MAKKKGQQKYIPLCVAVEPSLIESMDRIARETERNRSQTFRFFVKEGMKAAGYGRQEEGNR